MPSSLAGRLQLTFTLSSLIVFSFLIFLAADLLSAAAAALAEEVSAMSGSRFEDFLLEYYTCEWESDIFHFVEISHLMGEDRDDFLEELDDDAESSVPELEVAPESQPDEEDGPVKDCCISS